MDHSLYIMANLHECTACYTVQIVPEEAAMALPVFLSFGLWGAEGAICP